MAPQKRRKLSSDDAESSNATEITENRSHAPVDEANQEAEVGQEKAVKNGDAATTDNEICPDQLLAELQELTSGIIHDKDVPRQSKGKASGEDESMKPTRISERLIIKRNRLGDTEDDCSGPSQTQTPPRKGKVVQNTAPKQQQKKDGPKGKKMTRRPCAVWTLHDKKLFFMYIGEYGKNFEAISKKLSYVAKMRNAPQKDKMQVGYFYYRCWAKISKFIRLSETSDVKPVTQELYGLINYGVLYNIVKETHPEFGRCLNELIHYGETSCLLKVAKTKRLVKLKTPRCAYLKKINRIEDKIYFEASATKIPTQVTLELTPKNSPAWAKVQELSQNPRIRFKLSTNRTLESVFRYLGSKWKSNRIRLKEALGGKEEEATEELTCTLHPSCKITPVTFIPQEQRRLQDITFKNYREHVLPFLVKKKKSKVSKDQEKTVDETSASDPPQNDLEGENKTAHEESGESLGKTNQSEDKNGDKNMSAAEAMECAPAEDNPKDNSALSPPKSPLSKLPSVSSSVPDLPEDENAVFMDLSKFSQPSTPDNTHKGPLSPPSSVTSKSSPPLRSQSVLNVVVPSSLPALSVPSSLFSPSSSKANVILSPSLSKKKLTKSSKRRALSLDFDPSTPQDTSDNSSIPNVGNANNSSPNKPEATTAAVKNVTEEAEREYERLCNLASSGFTQANSNNVTLLHLSLILGKASVIRLEYEWREIVKSKPQVLPAFCKATSQMANVLRRLCNIAQLELTSFQQETKMSDASKGQSSKSSTSRYKKRDGVRDISTMTDPIKPTLLPHPNTRTFIAANAPQTIQLNGHDSVFRVPLVPAIPPSAPSKEEQEKLKLQEQQAKAILHQGPRNRLLKKRITPKTRKPPPIIVQRTLLPKVSSPLITYVQGLGGQPQMMVNVKAEEEKASQPSSNTISSNDLPDISKLDPIVKNGSDILSLAAQAAEIDEMSAVSQDSILELGPTGEYQTSLQTATAPPVSVPVSTLTSSSSLLSSESPVKNVSTLTSQSDISLSDFDISLSSANASNMGPDAGDKFLDSVLQNSQQGFSGLINSTKKSQGLVSDGSSQLPSISVDTDLAGFGSSMLHTPPHSSSSSSYHPPVSSLEFPSPMNLNIGEQPWLSTDPGDISLSSILGESSLDGNKPKLKTPTKSTEMSVLSQSIFFDGSSSDAVDNPVISPNKSPFVSDISLSCLLNDSNLGAPKNVESLNTVSNDGLAISKETPSDNIFSSVVCSEVPPSTLFSEASQDSFTKLDVDVTFQGMVSESSMDFVTKFEKLAAHITENQDQDSKLNTPIKRQCDGDTKFERLTVPNTDNQNHNSVSKKLNTPIKKE